MTLTAVMIVGVITVVALLVTRMPQAAPPLTVPSQISLPDGARPKAFTQGDDFFAVVTTDDRILIFRRDGSLRQEVAIAPDPAPAP